MAKTEKEKMNELIAAGWDKVGDINQVYARTATQADGGNMPNPTPSTPQGYQPVATPQGHQPAAVDDGAAARKAAQEAQVLAGFKESSGFSREELAERKRQFDQEMSYKEAQWQREGLPTLEIAKRRAALEEQRFQEEIRQFNSSQGMDYLKFASTLQGPADFFQSADFNRGAQQRGDVPTFLNALSQNTPLPSFTGPGGVAPTPMTATGLGAQLTGGQPGSGVTVNGQTVVPPGAVPATAGPGGYSPEQIAAIHTQMNQQIGTNNWAGGVFNNLLAQGVPIQEAIARSAQGMGGVPMKAGTYTMPTIPTPAAATPVAAAQPVATGTNTLAAVAPAPVPYTSAGGYSTDQALNQVGSIFKAGGNALKAGTLEALDPNELALLKSGAGKLGYDYDSWIRNYQRSGVGQTAGSV